MHELSICRSITGIVERHAAGRPVERVCIDVGGLRQVVPDTLRYCWDVATEGTPLAGAVLDVSEVPAVIDCRACGHRTTLVHPVFRCEACRSADTAVVSGDELSITSLVLQEV